jgi:crotonobetainyl-CoA:carnitine CoA-transferase CaiB-like acyl-CoA transferase
MVGPPVDFGAATPPPVAQAPQAGQHTEAILIDLGYDWDDIERLKQAEVVQ